MGTNKRGKLNRHQRRAAKASGDTTRDDAFARAICDLARVMKRWLSDNPNAQLSWHLLATPPGGVATSDPSGRAELANSSDADRMLREADADFARETGASSTLFMARTALALVEQLPHIDGIN
jgi:hypothetical protein